MKSKNILYALIVLFSITLMACSGTAVNFYTPGEQRFVQYAFALNEGLGNADVVFTPINQEDILDSKQTKDEAYVYVASIIYEDNKQGNYANVVTPGIDTEQNIRDSGFEIKNIKYYKVHIENRSDESVANNVDLKVLALKIIKRWCRQDAYISCFMP